MKSFPILEQKTIYHVSTLSRPSGIEFDSSEEMEKYLTGQRATLAGGILTDEWNGSKITGIWEETSYAWDRNLEKSISKSIDERINNKNYEESEYEQDR